MSLTHILPDNDDAVIQIIDFSLVHGEPQRDADELVEEAVAAASEVAVVVVATTERAESEGFDRTSLRLPGRQDELVARVGAANPRTVVNSGSPVELPWRDDVAAILLSWFPGKQAGAALADVLLGAEEPGGRLPTTWPSVSSTPPSPRWSPPRTAPSPTPRSSSSATVPGSVPAPRPPAYWFGHGLGHTQWSHEAEAEDGRTATVRVRNTGSRPGREVVQLYLAPVADTVERPARWLAGFASVQAAPGEAAEVAIDLPARAFQIWDEDASAWTTVPGTYAVEAGRSVTDCPVSTKITVAADEE